MGTHYGLLKLHITDNSVLGRKKAVYLPTKTSRCQFCPVTIVWGTTAIPRGTLESIKYFIFRSNIQNIVTPVMEFAFKLNQHYGTIENLPISLLIKLSKKYRIVSVGILSQP